MVRVLRCVQVDQRPSRLEQGESGTKPLASDVCLMFGREF